MENLETIAKRRDIFQSAVRILIQKLTFSTKIWTEFLSNCESFFIDVVEDEKNSSSESEWTIDLLVNQILLSFKMDSGVQGNIILEKCFRILKSQPKLHKPNAKLTAYSRSSIPVKGSCILNIELKRKNMPVLFIVADITSQPVLGLKTSTQLYLIKRIINIDKTLNPKLPSYLNGFTECFGEIGCLRNEHHIVIDYSVPPTVNPPRRIPIALKEKVNNELQQMLKTNIIAPIEELTDWVYSMIVVEKPNGNLKICIDPRNLNKAILSDHIMQFQRQKKFCRKWEEQKDSPN